MKALNAKQLAEYERLTRQLQSAWSEVETARDDFADRVSAEWQRTVEAAMDEFNRLVEEWNGFAGGVATQIGDELDEWPEAKRDGDIGRAVQAWQDQWQSAELVELTWEQPEAADFEDADISPALECPTEADI